MPAGGAKGSVKGIGTLKKSSSTASTTPGTGMGQVPALDAENKRLVLKKRVMKNPQENASDPIEYNLLYAQVGGVLFAVLEYSDIQVQVP